MWKFTIFVFLAFLCAADDTIFEMGTPDHPKENLPFNDDVTVKTLVQLFFCSYSSICLMIVPIWLWMVMSWVFITLFVLCAIDYVGLSLHEWKEVRFFFRSTSYLPCNPGRASCD